MVFFEDTFADFYNHLVDSVNLLVGGDVKDDYNEDVFGMHDTLSTMGFDVLTGKLIFSQKYICFSF